MKQEFEEMLLDKLLLDEKNPRLADSVGRSQQEMIDHIVKSTSIEELMDAIAENDFFPGEPLIVVPAPEKNKFVVVEGNRRLTALKLLQNPALTSNPGGRIREIADNARYKPATVPVVIRPERADVLPYLGFRHITGVKQWEPLAKAAYIYQIFESTDIEKSTKERYAIVARTIGSRRDHIKRNLDALAVYKIISKNDFYNIEGLDDQTIKFSVLSTALADNRIGAFVGVTDVGADGEYIDKDPIINQNALKNREIQELTKWLFEKDEKGRTKVGESRNLRMLGAVVDNKKSLSAFRNNSPLKIAYQLTKEITLDFLNLLYGAEGELAEAASLVANVEYNGDAFEAASRILRHIKLIGRTLKEMQRSDDDEF